MIAHGDVWKAIRDRLDRPDVRPELRELLEADPALADPILDDVARKLTDPVWEKMQNEQRNSDPLAGAGLV